jgi:hypothetical protein
VGEASLLYGNVVVAGPLGKPVLEAARVASVDGALASWYWS